jgi:imidazolonepropionase-like amidohydrolase
VTTVRSSGVSSYADVGLRELVKQGALPGPDVVATGYHVRPVVADEAFIDHPSLGSLMRDGMQANLSRGVDWIKVLATERAGTPETDPRRQVYNEAEIAAVVEEAAAKNVPVQAHAHGVEGALAAIRAGVRLIDVAEPGGDYDNPALMLRGAHMRLRHEQTIKRAHQLGVKIVTGADTAYGPNSITRISREVAELVRISTNRSGESRRASRPMCWSSSETRSTKWTRSRIRSWS